MSGGVNPTFCRIESAEIAFVPQIVERIFEQGAVTRFAAKRGLEIALGERGDAQDGA
jgi:hypothetical protein